MAISKTLRKTSVVIQVILLVTTSFFTSKSMAQVYLEERDSKVKIGINLFKINNLDSLDYNIRYENGPSFPNKIIINKTKNNTNGSTGSVSNTVLINKLEGEVVLSGELSIKNISKNGSAGLFLQAVDKQGNVILFDNMSEVEINNNGISKVYTIKLPFDKPIAKVIWGVYISGKGEVLAQNITLTLGDGEFSKKWGENYMINPVEDHHLVKRLTSFANVWGFLKYYHPVISKGKVNWDNLLIETLPKIFKAKTDKDYNDLVNKILISIGEVSKCDSCHKAVNKELLVNYTDFKVNDQVLNVSNKTKLEFIRDNFKQDLGYYVSQSSKGTPNPEFENEEKYKFMKLPDVNYRVLSLFRYWNVINYFYPYKYAIGSNWHDILRELVPVFVNARTTKEYHKAILLMNASLNDSHAANIQGIDLDEIPTFFRDSKVTLNSKLARLPLQIKVKDGYTTVINIDSAFSAMTGIRNGSSILSINNKSMRETWQNYFSYISASNPAFKDYFITKKNLLATTYVGSDSIVKIEYVSNKKVQTMTIRYNMLEYVKYFRMQYTPNNKAEKPVYRFLSDSVVYIDPSKIDSVSLNDIRLKLKSLKAIIIDFRIYPRYYIGNLLKILTNGKTPGVKFQWINLSHPGVLFPSTTQYFESSDSFTGRTIALIDEGSLSQSEFWSMLFKNSSSKSIAVGRPTAGADGDISSITIPGNITLYFSGIRINYPDGKETQRIGIQPDILVDWDLNDELQAKDTILDKALHEIN